MIKAYKYRLFPNGEQRIFFEKSFGCARYVYNWACPNCGQHNDRDLLAAINIKRFGLQSKNLIGYSPVADGVEDVEWSALVGTVKCQYVLV